MACEVGKLTALELPCNIQSRAELITSLPDKLAGQAELRLVDLRGEHMAGADVLVYVAMLRSLISVRTLKLDLLDQSSAFGRPEGDVQHRAGLHDVMGEVVRMTQLEWLELGQRSHGPMLQRNC